jgi:general secretion pathway protein G
MIELLTVIAILAILAGLLFPVFARAKRAAKQTTCLSNLNQLGSSIALYEGDYDDVFPFAVDPSDKWASDIWDQSPQWKAEIPHMPLLSDALQPYLKNREVLHCPADTGMYYLDSHYPTVLECAPSMFATYGSSYLFRTEIAFRYLTQSDFKLPANVNVLMDGAGNWHGNGRELQQSDDSGTVFELLSSYRYNTLFGDFHAKNLTYDQMQQAWQTPL